MSAIYKVPTQNSLQFTLDAQLAAGGTSLTLNSSATGLVQVPGVLVIDRVDSAGNKTPTKREYITCTGVSTVTLSGLTRGLAGSTDQVHSVGAIVEFIPDIIWAQSIYDALVNLVVASTGALDTTKVVDLTTAQTLTNKTLTSPKIGTSIKDTNGATIITLSPTSSAVNNLLFTNQATGSYPAVQVTGSDSDVGLDLVPQAAGPIRIYVATGQTPMLKAAGADTNLDLALYGKGTGKVKLATGAYQAAQAYSPAGAGTATLNLALGNVHNITMPAGNITIALSNESVGQIFAVSILQDSSGSRTVTWFSTIRWAGGSPPTLTTTASKRDTFIFIVTGSGTYDGFIVGQAA